MAISTTTQTIIDGARNVVMKFTGVADGPGDEVNVLKVDVAAMNPPAGPSLKVRKISAWTFNGIVQLSWDADTPQPFAELQLSSVNDYTRFGGLTNSGGPTATGSILLSTQGFNLGSSYDITIEMIKGV